MIQNLFCGITDLSYFQCVGGVDTGLTVSFSVTAVTGPGVTPYLGRVSVPRAGSDRSALFTKVRYLEQNLYHYDIIYKKGAGQGIGKFV